MCYHKTTHFAVSKKEDRTKRRTKVSSCVHFMYCGMPQDICLAEVKSNSDKIKFIVLAITELYLYECIIM